MVKKHKDADSVEEDKNIENKEEPAYLEEKAAGNNDTESKGHALESENIINNDKDSDEVSKIKEQLQQKEDELTVHIDLMQRVKAEFDNYKKRTIKEKEQLYTEITGDIITRILPIVDNLERAIDSALQENGKNNLIEGVEMTLRQFKDILNKEGVEEIDSLDKQFDPAYHNAVMHVEDESYGTNVIIEVFQKGYKIKDKILRYSMVKVAN